MHKTYHKLSRLLVRRLNMSLEELRKKVEGCLLEAIKDPNKRKVQVSRRATGSASGLPFEPWTKNILKESGFSVFLQEEFVEYIINEMRRRKYSKEKIKTLINEKTWWGVKNYVISRSQLNAAIRGTRIPTYQQSMADIVLFYGCLLYTSPSPRD